MAIQGSYNLDNALYSQAYAYKCWYNYNYGGNTLGISAGDIGKITQTWNSELTNWQNTAMDDENAYEIEDDDYSRALDDGYKQAQDKTGYDGGKNGMGARSGIDAGVAITGAVISAGGGKLVQAVAPKVVTAVGEKAVLNAAEKTGETIAYNAVGEASQSAAVQQGAAKSIGCIAGCVIGLAQGTAYQLKKPNKDQKEACDDLQDEMVNSQAALNTAQGEMETAADEVTTLSDEAAEYNESANETIEETKSEFDFYRASYEALMAKVEAGETLSEDEKSLLKELVPIMQELGVTIEETSGDTTDTVSEIYDEMGSYQEAYDNSAETIAEVQGVTDFAESFDEATRTNCYVEAAAQGLNAASSGTSAAKAFALANSGSWAFGATAWAYAFAGMGLAGAGLSGWGAKEQINWAGQVGNEIEMRENTQDLNATTTDIYDESIDGYEGYMSTVEDMELLIPEDMEAPEEVPDIPEGENDATPVATGFGLGATTADNNSSGTNNPTKKDEDEKKA